MQRFQNLQVWQRSHTLVLALDRLTAHFPPEERYRFTAQLRRAAVSVPANIAEGSKRRPAQDYARFLNLAEGSIAEVEHLLLLNRDLRMATEKAVAKLLEEATAITRMLKALRSRVLAGQLP